jgi:hypothetical protein
VADAFSATGAGVVLTYSVVGFGSLVVLVIGCTSRITDRIRALVLYQQGAATLLTV